MERSADEDIPSRRAGLLLAVDQGTTNTKALLVDPGDGRIVARGACPVPIRFPGVGAVEQDAEEIWSSLETAIDECLSEAGDPPLAGVAISNQRESVAIWDADTGEALGPVLGWQDARTADACTALSAHAAMVRERTGLPLDPMFSAPKMRWLLTRAPRARTLRLGTIDTYLVERLTGRYVAEAGNASRTLLFNLQEQDWDAELLEVFGISDGVLAPVVRSDAAFGTTRPGLPVPAGVPVRAVLADSHAALYFHGGGARGAGKVTYGTGSSVMVPAGSTQAPDGVATTLAWLTDTPVFAREGNIVASGAALAWMAQILTQGDVSALADLASGVTSSAVTFVPAFSGLGAPHFDRQATGLMSGITAGTGAAEMARAAFDAVAHQVADVVEAIEADSTARMEILHADGGASASGLLMQTQADLVARQVQVAGAAESSALGAALLAARSAGADDDGWWQARGGTRTVAPLIDATERADRRAAWHAAVRRSRGRSVVPDPAGDLGAVGSTRDAAGSACPPPAGVAE